MTDLQIMRSRSGNDRSSSPNRSMSQESNESSNESRPFINESSSKNDIQRASLIPSLNANAAYGDDFQRQALKLSFCFTGLLMSYLTWGYMQELIMTSTFTPTEHSPEGKFPSAAFCVFSNRFLAIIVAMISVKLKHGSVFGNNVAALHYFIPCALSNTMSSWSQYASLRYVSFPVQTVFKSSKIIPVMIMGKFLKGTSYPKTQYVEALFITIGVAIFSVFGQESKRDSNTEVVGLIFMLMYITFDCFTSQWQDKIYMTYGRSNVDPYQMMLGVNLWAICITTVGLLVSGDFPLVIEFFQTNPNVFVYNVITAITSASAYKFGHHIRLKAFIGAVIVFGVLFYQIRRKYVTRKMKEIEAKNVSVVGSPTKAGAVV